VKSPLEVRRSASRAGRRIVERLAGRAAGVLDAKTRRRAARIVEEVRQGGDRALLACARRWDGARAETAGGLALGCEPAELDPSDPLLPAGFAEALERAIAAAERYHAPQARSGYRLDHDGVELPTLATSAAMVRSPGAPSLAHTTRLTTLAVRAGLGRKANTLLPEDSVVKAIAPCR